MIRVLILILLASTTSCFNVVVDVHNRGVQKFIDLLKVHVLARLDNHELVEIFDKSLMLGHLKIEHLKISQVSVERFHSTFLGGEYYLEIQHLHAKLHGHYSQNLLLINQGDDFDIRIRDLNATIGPITPAVFAGFPYVDNSRISCSVQHDEDDFDVHGNILRHLAKRRLQETLKADLESILRLSFLGILETTIKSYLDPKFLPFKLSASLDEEIIIGYSIRNNVVQPGGELRYFMEGHTSVDSTSKPFIVPFKSQPSDVTFTIHKNLISNVIEGACSTKYLDVSIDGLYYSCKSMELTEDAFNDSDRAVMNAVYKANSMLIRPKYKIFLQFGHSEKKMAFNLRMQSEIDEERFIQNMFQAVKSKFDTLSVPIVFPGLYVLDVKKKIYGGDRITIIGNVEPGTN